MKLDWSWIRKFFYGLDWIRDLKSWIGLDFRLYFKSWIGSWIMQNPIQSDRILPLFRTSMCGLLNKVTPSSTGWPMAAVPLSIATAAGSTSYSTFATAR
jgi:hypothetical protein